jgi:uncharacterized phage protein gp47/JayE
MGNTPVCSISPTGISRPSLAAVLAYFADGLRGIFGSDVSLDSSTQDGEWVGLLSSAVDDANAMAVQAYNAFSPATAQGVGLSRVVKINGLARLVPSVSTAQILVVGEAGRPIVSGLLTDDAGYTWALPDSVVIPYSGQIVVTATCETPGAIAAPGGTIRTIANSQPGWQTAINTADATPGLPVESDATLRRRQSQSTMNASTAILEGIVGELLALPDVARVRGYENEHNLPDENGIPGHCIAIVIDGGDKQSIIDTIKRTKGGCGTYGSTSGYAVDAHGIPTKVAYFALGKPQITAVITIKKLAGFTTDAELLIQNSVAAWVNSSPIGAGVQWTRGYAAAYLNGAPQSQTFEVQAVALARDGVTPTAADIGMNFNEAAFCRPQFVSVVVSNPLG